MNEMLFTQNTTFCPAITYRLLRVPTNTLSPLHITFSGSESSGPIVPYTCSIRNG